MGYSRFKAIKASFLDNGVVARVHGNKGKSSRKERLTLKQIQDVVQFIMNYAGVCTSGERERGGMKMGQLKCMYTSVVLHT